MHFFGPATRSPLEDRTSGRCDLVRATGLPLVFHYSELAVKTDAITPIAAAAFMATSFWTFGSGLVLAGAALHGGLFVTARQRSSYLVIDCFLHLETNVLSQNCVIAMRTKVPLGR